MPPHAADPPFPAPGPPSGGLPPRFHAVAIASGLLSESELHAVEAEVRLGPAAALEHTDPVAWDRAVAEWCVKNKKITKFQAREILAGRRRFTLGQYRVLDEIGRGGMGQVFKAEHAMMGRLVAVKVLPRAKSTPETEAAFQREIRMLARLDHENLVRALDAGHDGNVYYLVTEYVPGADLRRQVLKFGALNELQAASVIAQAARGLAYAHGQGLVHRDVKPGNLLVSREGRVKVLDLGLAGSVFEEESMRMGRCVGTMDYMAPEQIRSPDSVGPAADVYGLGCTLYFALTKQPPFPGGTRQEKARRHLTEKPQPIGELAPHVGREFARVVEAMMAKSPQDRIATAGEVIGSLRPWIPASLVPMPRSLQPHMAPTTNGVGRPGTATLGGSSGFQLGGQGSSDFPLQRDTLRDGIDLDETSFGSQRTDGDPWPSKSPPSAEKMLRFAGPVVARMVSVCRRAVVWLGSRFDTQRVLAAILHRVVFAGVAGFAFGMAILGISQLAPRWSAILLGSATAWSLGWTAFAVMLGVQVLASLSQMRNR